MKYGSLTSYRIAMLIPLFALGCTDEPQTPYTWNQSNPLIVERIQNRSADKLDLVLAIDNSRAMEDKQVVLDLAIPNLIKELVNPRCVDKNGIYTATQPNNPTDSCPPLSKREFKPVTDMHIAVISSSLGGHGADSCPNVDTASKECSPNPNVTNNDQGHLLARLDPCGGQEVTTFMNKKFLAWDPANKYGGETVIDNGTTGLVPTLREMVIGVGQIGCGYESQLESVYRFLADPNPSETIIVDSFKAIPMGTDLVVLNQRAEFLRPDSVLTIVMLTDENDCSIKEFGQFYYVGQLRNGPTPVHLPRARQECAKDPNDPCCKSCGQAPGVCPDDPTCKDPNGSSEPALLSDTEDSINLRCWDQKRRFGIDFLYPIDRYVKAFSEATIADRDGNIVANPIFSDLNPADGNSGTRQNDWVFFAGIVGVPWQDIARNKYDLKQGFKSPSELVEPIDANGTTTWDVILGNPVENVQPLDPLMRETFQKRVGLNPIMGQPLANSSMPLSNGINGHEWTIPNDDLQYACIFPLLPGTMRDCTNVNWTNCDCSLATNDNPLCQADANNMNKPTLQVRGKAYPSLRELAVLHDLGSQGIVTSVCPAQLNNPIEVATDFGYRPAVRAIVDRVKSAFKEPCFQRTLVPDEQGIAPCTILEARNTQNNCNCDPAEARFDISTDAEKAKLIDEAKGHSLYQTEGWDCFCEILQTHGDSKTVCQNDTATNPTLNGQLIDGWCYVDATSQPPLGNVDIVKSCSNDAKRIIRFVGDGAAKPGATLFISCSGDSGG